MHVDRVSNLGEPAELPGLLTMSSSAAFCCCNARSISHDHQCRGRLRDRDLDILLLSVHPSHAPPLAKRVLGAVADSPPCAVTASLRRRRRGLHRPAPRLSLSTSVIRRNLRRRKGRPKRDAFWVQKRCKSAAVKQGPVSKLQATW